MKPLTVLVADDEEDICQLLTEWLAPAGHTVHTARNGTEGLVLAGHTGFDLVVTDVLMPDGDGLKLIEGLKQTQPAARILAISGGGRYMNGEEYLRIAQGFGAHAAIMKPFKRDQFLAAVEQTMAVRATTDA